MEMKPGPIVIHWFRRDLRMNDNTALNRALASGKPVLPVFIFDTDILENLKEYDHRLSFIYQALKQLHSGLQLLDSGLILYSGKPQDVFASILEEYEVAAVFANEDYEPYAISRDHKIRLLLEKRGIGFHSFKDQVIFDKDEIVKENGEPYKVFTAYHNQWHRQYSQIQNRLSGVAGEFRKDGFAKMKRFDLPEPESFGFHEVKDIYKCPEMSEQLIRDYDKTRNFPAIEGTSRLGVHLRFGTLSIREAVSKAMELNSTWLGELQWREFFMQILWHFPHVVENPFKPQYERIPWRNNEEEFRAWCEGKTGYSMVDAGMRELNETGFMHNRLRMITAGFLTKHLLIDWRWGENYFAGKLLDYELSSNNGNWQWAAGTGCDAAPYFRIFNPDTQAEKFDSEGKYRRKWVPEYGLPEYPKPIVDHAFARQRCLSAFSSVIR